MSSEALERAKKLKRIRYDLTLYVAADELTLARLEWLLAEVARLEQERDEALSVREGLISPVQKVLQLQAALAVARELEQRAVKALGGLVAVTELAVTLLDTHDSWLPEAEALSVALRAARAALVLSGAD